MDWYSLLKVAHVICAMSWFGGALVMSVLASRADRADDGSDLVAIALKVAFLGPRYFVPASLLTLLFGLLTAWVGQLWGQTWVLIGLGSFLASFLLGFLVLKPRSEKVERHYRALGVTDLVVRQSGALVSLAKLDIATMLVTVVDMVMKPSPNDYPAFAIMGLVLLGAVYAATDKRRARLVTGDESIK